MTPSVMIKLAEHGRNALHSAIAHSVQGASIEMMHRHLRSCAVDLSRFSMPSSRFHLRHLALDVIHELEDRFIVPGTSSRA